MVLYTSAGKVTYQLKGPVKFEADGNRESVQPGVLVKDGNEVVAWISAQAHGLVLVDDERLISVDVGAAIPRPEE